jgi:hypothetical protein
VDAKRRPRILPFAAALVIAYLVFAPNRAGREVVVRPAWSRSTTLPGTTAPAKGAIHAFRVGGSFGYVDAGGTIARLERVFEDVAVSDAHSVNYSRGDGALQVRSPDGSIAATLAAAGWPLVSDLIGDAVLIFSPDLLGLAECGPDGAVRWARDFGSLITCFAPAPPGKRAARCAVGTLDGTFRILGVDGVEIFRAASAGSRIAGAYGCAVSGDGRHVAAVLGLDPQRLVVIDSSGGAFREVWSSRLPTEIRAERIMCYSGDARYLVLDGGAGLLVEDSRGRRSWSIPARGILWAAVAVGGGVMAVLRDGDGAEEALFVVLPDLVLARATLRGPVGSPTLTAHEGFALHGAGQALARVDVARL